MRGKKHTKTTLNVTPQRAAAWRSHQEAGAASSPTAPSCWCGSAPVFLSSAPPAAWSAAHSGALLDRATARQRTDANVRRSGMSLPVLVALRQEFCPCSTRWENC